MGQFKSLKQIFCKFVEGQDQGQKLLEIGKNL